MDPRPFKRALAKRLAGIEQEIEALEEDYGDFDDQTDSEIIELFDDANTRHAECIQIAQLFAKFEGGS